MEFIREIPGDLIGILTVPGTWEQLSDGRKLLDLGAAGCVLFLLLGILALVLFGAGKKRLERKIHEEYEER